MTDPFLRSDGATIYCGDCREVLPRIRGDLDNRRVAVITDPPWPGPGGDGLVPGEESAYDVWIQVVQTLAGIVGASGRLAVVLGTVSDPRFLSVPEWIPFVRVCHLRYMGAPSFRGTVALSGDVVYVYGHRKPGEGRTLISGEKTTNLRSQKRRGSFKHPCPRNRVHMLWLVENLTRSSDLVLDPFCGSGTIPWAARELGRETIGIEVDPRWCSEAAERLSQRQLFPPGTTVREPQEAMFQ